MRKRSLTVLFAAAALATTSGCMTWNDRFYVPGQDPVLTFLRGERVGQYGDWPPARLPSLRPMRTEFIPDRVGPPADPILPEYWRFPAPLDQPPSPYPPL